MQLHQKIIFVLGLMYSSYLQAELPVGHNYEGLYPNQIEILERLSLKTIERDCEKIKNDFRWGQYGKNGKIECETHVIKHVTVSQFPGVLSKFCWRTFGYHDPANEGRVENDQPPIVKPEIPANFKKYTSSKLNDLKVKYNGYLTYLIACMKDKNLTKHVSDLKVNNSDRQEIKTNPSTSNASPIKQRSTTGQ